MHSDTESANKDVMEMMPFEARFINEVVELCSRNKGFAARLRRADNPATEYQSWEFLARMGIDLEKGYRRLPAVTVASAVAKAKIQANGALSLGQALARCYEKGNESEPAQARLRRLLACQSVEEVCLILRSVFALLNSKVPAPLDYARILKQLRSFYFDEQRVKAQWAQEFYSYQEKSKSKKGGEE